jgi:hypothetical protein
MALVNVSINTAQLAAWAAELSERGMRNALRRAIDQSARAARKVAVKVIASDIGVAASKLKSAVPKVVTTKAGDLSARWTVTKMRISIADVQGASITKSGGLHASTHRLTGGGSASLDVKKAFLVKMANGARFVAFRRGSARNPIKAIYAEHPASALGQDGAAARVTWQKTADTELSRRLPIEIGKAFVSEGLSPNTPDTGD